MKTFIRALLAFCWLLGACAPSTGPGAQDPERMAESEYDIARDLWLRQGNLREALDHGLKAVELDDQNADADHLVALLYLDFCSRNQGDCRLPEAEKYARRALELRPEFREAKNTLGVILIHTGRPNDAIQVLKPLCEDILYETPEKAWGNLGWAYLEAKDPDRAIEALKRSIAAQPLFCVGAYRLGLAYELKGQDRQALEAFTRALETEAPECSRLQDAYWGRARVAERLGDMDSVSADLARCVELSESTTAGKNCGSMLKKLK
jgi:type IV pilus assembly protein PilF